MRAPAGRFSARTVRVKAPGKVNVSLDVGPLRPDGYHSVASVYLAVSLYEEVTATVRDDDKVTVSVRNGSTLPLELDEAFLEECRASLPELPDAKRKRFEGLGITKVVGIEARGFIIAAPVAHRLRAGFVPVARDHVDRAFGEAGFDQALLEVGHREPAVPAEVDRAEEGDPTARDEGVQAQ